MPPTISPEEMLFLFGDILDVCPTAEATAALRMRFFQPGFSWQALVDLAVAHDVLPGLVYCLTARTLLLPVPHAIGPLTGTSHVTSRLRVAYQEHLARNNDLRDQLVDIIGALNRRGIEPLVIKGARHLLLSADHWLQARGMRDLDIVVAPEEADLGLEALKSCGYLFNSSSPLPVGHHLSDMYRPGRDGAVDLHTSVLPHNAAPLMTDRDVRSWSEPHSELGLRFRALPTEWHMLHGLLHHQVADRGHARRILAIKGLWEFAMQARGLTAAAWTRIAAHMKDRHHLDVLSGWTLQSNRLFKLPLPECVEISDSVRRGVDATFQRAGWPYPLRRMMFVTDQLRFAFSRDTLAARYGTSGRTATARSAMRHLFLLVGRYRGDAFRRLSGRSDRIS